MVGSVLMQHVNEPSDNDFFRAEGSGQHKNMSLIMWHDKHTWPSISIQFSDFYPHHVAWSACGKNKTIDPTTWNIWEHFQMQLFLMPSQHIIIITNCLQIYIVYKHSSTIHRAMHIQGEFVAPAIVLRSWMSNLPTYHYFTLNYNTPLLMRRTSIYE